MLLDEQVGGNKTLEALDAEVVFEKLWMQMQAEAMERCIVGDHRRNATTTPHHCARTTDTSFQYLVSHRTGWRKVSMSIRR